MKDKQAVARILVVAAGIAAATALHYLTSPSLILWHNLFQRLYYLPIIYAAIYFGWRGPDGRLRVGVLQGAVLTPLPLPAGGTEPSWGHQGPGAQTLAAAVVTHATGHQPDPQLVELFAKEVIDPVTGDELELPATQVHAWLARQPSHCS